MWLRIAKLGDLPADLTLHILRHNFASLAADLEYNDPTHRQLDPESTAIRLRRTEVVGPTDDTHKVTAYRARDRR
jgi:hypothetical protein